jgi:hypothetical protein
MSEPIFIKLGMHVKVPAPISKADLKIEFPLKCATFFFFVAAATCFGLSSDHHQVLAASFMYAL